MNAIKCSNCGLVNLASDTDCRRCGQSLAYSAAPPQPQAEPVAKSRRVGNFIALGLVLGVLGLAIYEPNNLSYEREEEEKDRVAAQQKLQAEAVKPRSPFDRETNVTRDFRDSLDSPERFDATQKALKPTLDKMEKENQRMRQVKNYSVAAQQSRVPPPQ